MGGRLDAGTAAPILAFGDYDLHAKLFRYGTGGWQCSTVPDPGPSGTGIGVYGVAPSLAIGPDGNTLHAAYATLYDTRDSTVWGTLWPWTDRLRYAVYRNGSWSFRNLDVLGHVGFATQFGTTLLRGQSADFAGAPDPPRSAVIGDPAEWWAGMVVPAKDAVHGADLATVVDSPMGRRSIGEGLSFPAVDLFLHGWDLAHSAAAEVSIPAEAMDFAHHVIDAIPEQYVRSARVFGAEIEVAPEASPQVRFLAWAGRDAVATGAG